MSFQVSRPTCFATVLWAILATPMTTFASAMLEGTSVRAEINPAPGLEPAEVTRIQLEALRSNTPENEGIALTYRFASPENRRATGPLPRFVAMVRSPPYDHLVNHASVDFGPVVLVDGKAYQPVVVSDAQGDTAGYLWILSRQTSGEFEGCWMTDAVISTDDGTARRLAMKIPQASGFPGP